jgi:hypothetical protein
MGTHCCVNGEITLQCDIMFSGETTPMGPSFPRGEVAIVIPVFAIWYSLGHNSRLICVQSHA